MHHILTLPVFFVFKEIFKEPSFRISLIQDLLLVIICSLYYSGNQYLLLNNTVNYNYLLIIFFTVSQLPLFLQKLKARRWHIIYFQIQSSHHLSSTNFIFYLSFFHSFSMIAIIFKDPKSSQMAYSLPVLPDKKITFLVAMSEILIICH